MTIAFISDLHLTPDRPHSSELFGKFVSNASGALEELFILGDLFEYWIGDDASETLGHTTVEQSLSQLATEGVRLYFMRGNRDFLIAEQFAARTGCTLLDDPTVIERQGLRILLSHGDALCTDDLAHQAARAEMLEPEWIAGFLARPINERAAAAGALRQKSEQDKQSKPMEIMDVNQDAVARCMADHDVEIMIHGHTHKPAAHEFERDGRLMRRYVLGDWYEQKSMILLENGRLTLRR